MNVDAVAEGLEGVEGDAHRENKVEQQAIAMAVKKSVSKRLGKEVVVLEETEDKEVDDDIAPEGPKALLLRECGVADNQT